MKFRYPLQKIVDLKNNELTQAEWMLSEAVGKLQIEETSLDKLHSEKQILQDSLSSASKNSAKISELQVFQEYLFYIEQQISIKHKDVEKALNYVNSRQDQLTDKMLDEKVWSKAKEKAYSKFKASLLQKEQQQLDELATIRYIHT